MPAPSLRPVKLLSADDLFAAEKAVETAIPALGIGSGAINLFVGESFVAKSWALLAAGLAVATGRPLWGAWKTVPGPWLHLDLEQGARVTKSRLRRLARGMAISDEELRALVDQEAVRVAVFPDLRLDSQGAAAAFRHLFEGVRLVTVDSLRTIAGSIDENDSRIRSALNVLSSAADKTDASVWVIHHGGKPQGGDGPPRARKHLARGSSAIGDEAQSIFTASSLGFGRSRVHHVKTRSLTALVPDFELTVSDVPRGDDPTWGARVLRGDSSPTPPAVLSPEARLLAVLEGGPFAGTRDAFRAAAGIGAAPFRSALAKLLATGAVTEADGHFFAKECRP